MQPLGIVDPQVRRGATSSRVNLSQRVLSEPAGDQEIVFSAPVDGNCDVYITADSGGPPRRHIRHLARGRIPSTSPDDRLIALLR